MNAARDGVDRFGTPNLGGSTPLPQTPSGAMSPPTSQAQQQQQQQHATSRSSFEIPAAAMGTTNLNENLRNIGKFFKRDLGGFGGRFGRQVEDGGGGGGG